MNLKELITKMTWEEVCNTFLSIYPDQKEGIIEYQTVYKKLCKKVPVKSKMVLCFENHESDEYIEVYGTNGTTRDDESLEQFTMSLTPWTEWLGSSISQKALDIFTYEEIISYCLFDMTFYGFTEAKIKSFGKELNKRSKDLHDPIRYVILSNIFRKRTMSLFFNISDEVWCSDIDSATIFKNESHASVILKQLKDGKSDTSNIIAKITTKNKKRKILKYYD